MERKEFVRQFSAGLFFLLGVFLIFVFIFTIGKDKGFSRPKFQVTVLFRDVGGLGEGAPVRLAGVNIGNVEKVDFLEESRDNRRVFVRLNIYSRFKRQLEKSTAVAIRTQGVLGEKMVEIYVVEGEKPLDINQPIIGAEPFDVQDLAMTFANAAQSFTQMSHEISQINMVELSKTMQETSRALMMTSQGMSVILIELDDMTLKAKRLLDRFEQKLIEGELFKVF